MSESIQTRVKKLIEDRAISIAEAERMCGLAKDTLRKLLNNPDQDPSRKTLSKVAKGFAVTIDWLAEGIEPPAPASVAPLAMPIDVRNYGPGSYPTLPARQEMPNDVPVRGTAAGNHLKGAFKLGSDEIDWVRRPPALAGVKDLYALYVEGTSMEPQYFPSDLIFINPHKPYRVGDIVIVQLHDGDDGVEASIGIYLRKTSRGTVIGKRNPPSEVEMVHGGNVIIHKVLSNNEIFGI